MSTHETWYNTVISAVKTYEDINRAPSCNQCSIKCQTKVWMRLRWKAPETLVVPTQHCTETPKNPEGFLFFFWESGSYQEHTWRFIDKLYTNTKDNYRAEFRMFFIHKNDRKWIYSRAISSSFTGDWSGTFAVYTEKLKNNHPMQVSKCLWQLLIGNNVPRRDF